MNDTVASMQRKLDNWKIEADIVKDDHGLFRGTLMVHSKFGEDAPILI